MAKTTETTMKTLAIITVTVALITAATQAHSGGSRGYSSRGYSPSLGSSRSSSYVYRNAYAANPSVGVRSYTKSTGTFVAPHYRTPGNYTITDNLSYRGYGAVRLPR